MLIGPPYLDHRLSPWAMVRRRRTILLMLGYLLLNELSHAADGAIMDFPQGHHLLARTAHRGGAGFSLMLHVSVGTVPRVSARAKADSIAIEISSRIGLTVDVCKARFEIAIGLGLKVDVCKVRFEISIGLGLKVDVYNVVFEIAIGSRLKTPKIGIRIRIL